MEHTLFSVRPLQKKSLYTWGESMSVSVFVFLFVNLAVTYTLCKYTHTYS